MAIPAVVACYVVTGSDDFMVEVAAQDLADYEKVLLDEILAVPAVAHRAQRLRHPYRAEPRPGAADPLALRFRRARRARGAYGSFTHVPRAK